MLSPELRPFQVSAYRQIGSSAPLVGRDRDIAAIWAFADQSAVHGGALLVSGEAGVGKTAVIEAVMPYAVNAGLRLLRATGAQFEANVSFAGLHQLLFPLLASYLDQLDDAPRTALRSALGLHKGVAPDWVTLSRAALELLTRAASRTPILVVVDDVSWLDQASGRVLAFIARRTAGTRLGVLATMRTGEEGPFDRSGIGVYELRPLSHASSQALLDSRYPNLTTRAKYRLLSEAQGNPLALLELPIALNSRNATRALTETLPLTSRLQAVFAGRISTLPARTRHALLMAVLDGTGDLTVLRYGQPGSEADDLVPADRAQLISCDGATARVSFRHPLIRSAVVELATDEERRRTHRLLAERRAGDPARHAWHLAEASTGPDENVASLLQQVAHADRAGGAVAGVPRRRRAAAAETAALAVHPGSHLQRPGSAGPAGPRAA